jgi:hypothetical protein
MPTLQRFARANPDVLVLAVTDPRDGQNLADIEAKSGENQRGLNPQTGYEVPMEAQSIPQMFFTRAATRGDKPAQRVKVNGVWRDTSWRELHNGVRHTAQGLLDLGVQPHDRIAILADSRAAWVQCDLAIQATGAITIPVYPSLLEEQAAYILQHSETSLVFVDTSAQLAKVNHVRDQVPALRHVISMQAQTADTATLSRRRRRLVPGGELRQGLGGGRSRVGSRRGGLLLRLGRGLRGATGGQGRRQEGHGEGDEGGGCEGSESAEWVHGSIFSRRSRPVQGRKVERNSIDRTEVVTLRCPPSVVASRVPWRCPSSSSGARWL